MTWRSLREQVVLEGRLRLVQLLGEKAFACWPVKFDVREVHPTWLAYCRWAG